MIRYLVDEMGGHAFGGQHTHQQDGAELQVRVHAVQPVEESRVVQLMGQDVPGFLQVQAAVLSLRQLQQVDAVFISHGKSGRSTENHQAEVIFQWSARRQEGRGPIPGGGHEVTGCDFIQASLQFFRVTQRIGPEGFATSEGGLGSGSVFFRARCRPPAQCFQNESVEGFIVPVFAEAGPVTDDDPATGRGRDPFHEEFPDCFIVVARAHIFQPFQHGPGHGEVEPFRCGRGRKDPGSHEDQEQTRMNNLSHFISPRYVSSV